MLDLLIDFESFFDKDYTLKKMPTAQYLRDERFQCLGCGVMIPGELPPTYLTADKLHDFFDLLPWHRMQMTAHNAAFDAALLYEHYGKKPARIVDTQSEARYYIAQGMLPPTMTTSLAALASVVGMAKGDTEAAVQGGGASLAEYGTNDIAIMFALREHYRNNSTLPELEADLIDLHVRMASEPIFELDEELLHNIADEEVPEEIAYLRSKANFADVLRALGVEPEMKEGKKGLDYAFAKTDAFMQKLADHENPVVRELAEMRLNGASNIERTRAQRFLDMGSPMPVPLLYYGAHTGRASGNDKCNMQNLPARGGEPRLRRALRAPKGHKVIGIDSSQIEVRVLSWRARDKKTLEAYARGEDVYINLASSMYNTPYDAVDARQRQIAKSARLAAQFSQGGPGFKAYCARNKLYITDAEAQRAVNGFRNSSPRVVAYWSKLENLIRANKELVLPSGRKLTYPDLTQGRQGLQYERHSIFSKSKQREKTKIWGGFAVENETQAIARDVVMAQTVRLARQYKVALSAHDEAVLVVPEKDVADAVAYAEECFSWLPDWAEGLVVKGAAKVGNNYAEVK